MQRFLRAGLALARPAFSVLIISGTALAGDLPDWRDARTMPDLVATLDLWLDANTPWTRRDPLPAVRWTTPRNARALSGQPARGSAHNPRGFYDAERRTIHLVEPWTPGNPQDVSVLLHELAHHRQATAGHWYCPGAQELPAYRLQAAWLEELGLTAKINWIAVVLEAGCSPRDIHPD